ncbi:MAG: DUF4176 domain-containing protein [Coprococcus sp.]
MYPEGNIRVDQNFLFNHEQVEKVYCVGYIDEGRVYLYEQVSN